MNDRNTYFESTMKTLRADNDNSADVNTFNSMEEEWKLLEEQTNHHMAKFEGTTSNSAQAETLHNVIAGKKELIKWLRETIENSEVLIMHRLTLKHVTLIEIGILAMAILHNWIFTKLLLLLQDYRKIIIRGTLTRHTDPAERVQADLAKAASVVGKLQIVKNGVTWGISSPSFKNYHPEKNSYTFSKKSHSKKFLILS